VRRLILVLLAASAACSPTADRQTSRPRDVSITDTAAGVSPPPKPVLATLSRFANSFADDRRTIIARLGAPGRTTTRTLRVPADTAFTLSYPDASFDVVRYADGIEMLMEVRIWGALSGLPPSIALGATTRSELVTLVGTPSYKERVLADTTALVYQWFGSYSELGEFYLVADTVRLIRWRFRMG